MRPWPLESPRPPSRRGSRLSGIGVWTGVNLAPPLIPRVRNWRASACCHRREAFVLARRLGGGDVSVPMAMPLVASSREGLLFRSHAGLVGGQRQSARWGPGLHARSCSEQACSAASALASRPVSLGSERHWHAGRLASGRAGRADRLAARLAWPVACPESWARGPGLRRRSGSAPQPALNQFAVRASAAEGGAPGGAAAAPAFLDNRPAFLDTRPGALPVPAGLYVALGAGALAWGVAQVLATPAGIEVSKPNEPLSKDSRSPPPPSIFFFDNLLVSKGSWRRLP